MLFHNYKKYLGITCFGGQVILSFQKRSFTSSHPMTATAFLNLWEALVMIDLSNFFIVFMYNLYEMHFI